MKICKNCGTEIEDKAVVCVNCGVAQKVKKPIFKKWWFWLIIVLVIIIAASSSGGESESNSSSGGEKATGSQTVTYEKTDLQDMLDVLASNALKAEKTYQNKYVEVEGKISNFDSDGSYISIEPVNADEWNFETVTCNIENEDQLNLLLEKSVGDKVTIKGEIVSVGEILGYTMDIDEVN